MASTVFRFIAAITVATIVGQVAAILAAFYIEIVAGHEVTGGRWFLIVNVVLACFQGLVVGWVAGSIAKKRGMLIAALANFTPLSALIAIELIAIELTQNSDSTEYLATIYNTYTFLSAWIGLAPAMISGHFSAKAQQETWNLIQGAGVVGVSAFHIYTSYVAYQISGYSAALTTLSMPLMSELYWFLTIWHGTGVFFNLYTLRLLALGLFGAVLLGIGVKLQNSAKEQKKLHDHTVL